MKGTDTFSIARARHNDSYAAEKSVKSECRAFLDTTCHAAQQTCWTRPSDGSTLIPMSPFRQKSADATIHSRQNVKQ